MDNRLRVQRAFPLLARPILLGCVVLLAAGGCSVFDLSKNIPWGSGKDGQFTRPMKLISVWQDTVLHQDGAEPVRGFGGRVWFYGPDEQKPVAVEGTLEVYAYDETDRAAENTVPTRKYVFAAEDLEKHHSEGKLGDSYSFWLPWGDVNGPTIEISLICRFTATEGGGTMVGEETRHQLPGRELPQPKKRKAQTGQGTVGRARAYEAAAYQRAGLESPAPAIQNAPQANPLVQQANWQQANVAAVGYFAPGAPELTAAADSMAPPGNPQVQTPLGTASRMRVTTLRVPVQAGGVTPFTTTTLGQGMPLRGAETAAGYAPAATPAAAQTRPLATGYPPRPRRVLGGPIERLTREHDPRRPNLATWQYGHAPPPQ